MALLGIDLGGTKLAIATFNKTGDILSRHKIALEGRKGKEVGALIIEQIKEAIRQADHKGDRILAAGISVPGISRQKEGTVWVPNIAGWDDYPLLKEVKAVCTDVSVVIDSDRACYILGEQWQGNAKGCNDAVFLAVGTGIGAGILVNGTVLRGAHDIAGAIGWMALNSAYSQDYVNCGCFEHHASGEGIANTARMLLKEQGTYSGELKAKDSSRLTAHDVFAAFANKDPLAVAVFERCVKYWGMAVANLVSLFNPEKVILGGGVFGPATAFLPAIKAEAQKWAQPISIYQYSLESSALGDDAGVYGAGLLALKSINPLQKPESNV